MILLISYLLGFTVQVFRYFHHIVSLETKIRTESDIKNAKGIAIGIYLTVQFLFWWLFVVLDWLQDLGLIKSKN